MILPQHFAEWSSSTVDNDIIELNVRSLSGDQPYHHLTQNVNIPRVHRDAQWRWLRKRYNTWEKGGWFCNGLDPLNNWQPMDWGCYKPNSPRRAFDGKLIKYEHPLETQTRAFYLRVTRHIWRWVSKRFNIPTPDLKAIESEDISSAFWQWVKENNVPIIFTEGAKKAGCLLSAGYAAIALPGIYGGYRNPRDENNQPIGKPFLIPEVEVIATPGREIFICFDRDDKQRSVRNVNQATSTFGQLLTKKKCSVRVISWTQPHKGVDDLITACSAEVFESWYKVSPTFEIWKSLQYKRLTYKANINLNQRRLGELSIPDNAKLVGILSAKGTGKTWSLEREVEKALAAHKWVLVIGHRVQLVEALCHRFGINYITEVRSSDTGSLFGYGLCIDSLHPQSQARFKAENWSDGIVIIDEAEQVFWHGLNSQTCQSERVPILRELKTLLTNVLQGDGRIYLADADLSDVSIDYVRDLTGFKIDPFIVVNDWKPGVDECWDIFNYEGKNPSQLVKALEEYIGDGGKPFVICSAQKVKSKWSTQTLETHFSKLFPELRILRIDSETVSDPTHPAYGCIAHINQVLVNYDLVLASPSIETGVSIDIEGHFTSVWAIAQGVQPIDSVRQALARLREPVARHIWAKTYGFGKIGNGSTSVKSILASQKKAVRANIRLLQDADLEDIDIDFQPASLITWAKMAARINLGMANYRQSLIEALQADGHILIEADAVAADGVKEAVEAAQHENHTADAVATEQSLPMTQKEYEVSIEKKTKTKAERRRERKYQLEQRYGIPCTENLVLKDDDGWYPKLRLHYYLTVGREYLSSRDKAKLKSAAEKGQGSVFIPDVNRTQISAAVVTLEKLGLVDLINSLIQNGVEVKGNDEILQKMAAIATANIWLIKAILNITINEKDTPVAMAQRLLDKLGLNLEYLRREGSRGNQQRVYGFVDPGDGRTDVFNNWLVRDTEAAELASAMVATPKNVSSYDTVATPNNNKYIDTSPVTTEEVTTNPQTSNKNSQALTVGEVSRCAEAIIAVDGVDCLLSTIKRYGRSTCNKALSLIGEASKAIKPVLRQLKEQLGDDYEGLPA